MAGKGTNVQLGGPELEFIGRRGARSHRGGSVFSRSAVVSRMFEMQNALLDDADPRQVLPAGVLEAAIGALEEPWTLKPIEVGHLEEVLAAAGEELEGLVRGTDLNVRAVLDAVGSLSFAQKYALVDLAVQARAAEGKARGTSAR